jgi:hypothetical protein
MAALAIKRSGYAPMSGESDGPGWAGIAAIAGGLGTAVGVFVGIFFNSMRYAAGRGRIDGVLEAEMKAIALRVAALELRKDGMENRIQTISADMATKDDVRELRDDLKKLTEALYKTRAISGNGQSLSL